MKSDHKHVFKFTKMDLLELLKLAAREHLDCPDSNIIEFPDDSFDWNIVIDWEPTKGSPCFAGKPKFAGLSLTAFKTQRKE